MRQCTWQGRCQISPRTRGVQAHDGAGFTIGAVLEYPPTTHGLRLASAPAALPFPADPAAALAKAALLERLADLHQNEGCGWHADRLSHMAQDLRCRALGMPA